MNNLKIKHRNAYTINTADNSAEFDLYNMAGNVIDTFLIDLEDVDYIANYKWSKSQYGVKNYKVKNLARFIAARYIEDLKPSQSIIRINNKKLDYRKCNLRIGVTGSSSKDSVNRLNTDAKKCEKHNEYLHVYFVRKNNGTNYYRAIIASNNIASGKFCVSKSFNLSNDKDAKEHAIYTAYLFEKEYYGNLITDHEYERKEKEFNSLSRTERNKISSEIAPQLAKLNKLRTLANKHFETTSLAAIIKKRKITANIIENYSHNKNKNTPEQNNLPCGNQLLKATKNKKNNKHNKYTHVIESYATKKHNAHYIAQLKLNFVPKSFSMSFNIGKHKHAKEMAIYAAYLMEKIVYGDNVPKSEYDRKLKQISKLTVEETDTVNKIAAEKLESIYVAVNDYIRERKLEKKQIEKETAKQYRQIASAMAKQYERVKSDIEELAYGDHHRLKFVPTNRPNTRAYLHVGTIDAPDVGNAWFAEINLPKKNDKQLISRIKFLSRTHKEKTKPLAVYAAYLIEKTVYGKSIPKDEDESKMLEILKLTSDERFMVEKRILPKLKRLLDAVNETSNEQE